MSGIWETSRIVGQRFVSESFKQHVKRTLNEHQRILQAMEKNDGESARAVMVEHIRSGLELALAAHNRNHMDGNSSLRGPYASSAQAASNER